MINSSNKTAPQESTRTSPAVKVILWLLSLGSVVSSLIAINFAFNIDNSVEESNTKIDQTVETIGEVETNIGDRIIQARNTFNEFAANQVEPIAIEGWLVLETNGEYYQVALDESPVSPRTTTTTQAQVAPTTTTIPEALPRPRIGDYQKDREADGCHGVPGSDRWCFYSGGAASYVAWRVNSINFDGSNTFDNTYRLDELPDGPVVWGHARDWTRAARALGIPVDDTPTRGSIAQWESDGDYGFVAYVEDVTSDSDEADSGEDSVITIVLSHMNSDGESVPTDPTSWSLRDDRTCSLDACGTRDWPDKFIHIKDLN